MNHPSTPSPSMTRDQLAQASSRPAKKRFDSRKWAPYLFISPFFILFAVFSLFPLLFSIYLSFNQWEAASGIEAMQWVGLDNYKYALSDPWFLRSLGNTVWLALASGVPQHLVAIPLAAFIHHRLKRSRNLVIGIYFLPFITSSVAIAMVFNTLFSREYGQINVLLQWCASLPLVGGLFPSESIDWLGSSLFIKPAVAFVIFWRYLGWNLVLYLSALQVIPKDLYEAATIDGATPRQQFWYITLPQLRPMIYLAVTLTIMGNLQLFEEPFVLVAESSGVSQSVMTTAIFVYKTAFSSGDFGTASAISWLLFLIIASTTWVNNRIFKEGKR
ncbi:carbohydrate ABC transporter permease [Janthinobacterium aquaticum]|uniref:carbohydrate ABC transporter permease n=1 Tax=Janthinobacterium sp. FT58W TaxID=2654254 RepID=UPI001D0294AC|nr:sugar ABC transporter permease [Janthinobacterium sp. FT58W]